MNPVVQNGVLVLVGFEKEKIGGFVLQLRYEVLDEIHAGLP